MLYNNEYFYCYACTRLHFISWREFAARLPAYDDVSSFSPLNTVIFLKIHTQSSRMRTESRRNRSTDKTETKSPDETRTVSRRRTFEHTWIRSSKITGAHLLAFNRPSFFETTTSSFPADYTYKFQLHTKIHVVTRGHLPLTVKLPPLPPLLLLLTPASPSYAKGLSSLLFCKGGRHSPPEAWRIDCKRTRPPPEAA